MSTVFALATNIIYVDSWKKVKKIPDEIRRENALIYNIYTDFCRFFGGNTYGNGVYASGFNI